MIETPCFSEEPSYKDDYVGEGDPEIDDAPLALGTPEELLVGVVPGVGLFDDSPHPGFKRGGLAFLGDHADQVTALQDLSGDFGVVGAVEVDDRPLRQLPSG